MQISRFSLSYPSTFHHPVLFLPSLLLLASSSSSSLALLLPSSPLLLLHPLSFFFPLLFLLLPSLSFFFLSPFSFYHTGFSPTPFLLSLSLSPSLYSFPLSFSLQRRFPLFLFNTFSLSFSRLFCPLFPSPTARVALHPLLALSFPVRSVAFFCEQWVQIRPGTRNKLVGGGLVQILVQNFRVEEILRLKSCTVKIEYSNEPLKDS